MKLLIPARINLLGGWSDQALWRSRAAVVNMAVGWDGGDENWPHDPHPFFIDDTGFHTKVAGVGTGLGASSILFASRSLRSYFGQEHAINNAIAESLIAESIEGTRGGWQDAIGALRPGFKLITKDPDSYYHIEEKNDHPVIEHLLIFDTGIRRRSSNIGERVRYLFGDPRFRADLAVNVADAENSFRMSAEEFIGAALAGWARLVRWVPWMQSRMPKDDNLHGCMLAGAGGGGWGVAFMRDPKERQTTIERIRAQGFPCYHPIPCEVQCIRESSEMKHLDGPRETKHRRAPVETK